MTYSRRRVLATGAASFAAAGCLGDTGPNAGDSGSTDPDDENTETEDHEGGSRDNGNGGHGDGGSHDHGGGIPEGSEPSAEVAMVSEDGHHFEPHIVWIEAGGTVTWTNESGAHTTTAYHPDAEKPNRIPDGTDGWDSGLLGGDETFERTFERDGVYDYFCIPHEGAGMVGSVIVGEPDPHGQPGLEPPQDDLPDGARELLEQLNDDTNEALGHVHD